MYYKYEFQDRTGPLSPSPPVYQLSLCISLVLIKIPGLVSCKSSTCRAGDKEHQWTHPTACDSFLRADSVAHISGISILALYSSMCNNT